MNHLRIIVMIIGIFAWLAGAGQEICDNGKDDDGDGLIDLQDPDCQCHFQVQGNLLKNASFEDYQHCPTNYTYTSDAYIIKGWSFATYVNIDEANYYHNLECSYDSSRIMLFDPPVLPLPEGKGFVSIRQYRPNQQVIQERDVGKVYISQCLDSPLIAGNDYTLSLRAGRFKSNDDPSFEYKNEPFTVAVFGHPDCNAVPFGAVHAKSNGCPLNYGGWMLLGKVTLVSKGTWVQGIIPLKIPVNVNVLAIGPDCSILDFRSDLPDSTTALDYYMYNIDDLHLLPTTNFHFTYIQGAISSSCQQDSVLMAPVIPDGVYQWYKDSIAISGARGREYTVPKFNGEGTYNVRILTPDSCIVSEPYAVKASQLSRLHFPADTGLCMGDTLLLASEQENIRYSLNGTSSAAIRVTGAGIYHIEANDARCQKDFTVVVNLVDCTHFFMPNAFSPNDDGLNDVFRIPPFIQFSLQQFSIYDRWGERVFSTRTVSKGWDGTLHGKKCPAGIYLYVIEGVQHEEHVIKKGTVMLVR